VALRALEKAVRDIQEMGTLKVRAHPCSGEIRVTSRKFRVTAREVRQEASVSALEYPASSPLRCQIDALLLVEF
jgi:hypothetical protein